MPLCPQVFTQACSLCCLPSLSCSCISGLQAFSKERSREALVPRKPCMENAASGQQIFMQAHQLFMQGNQMQTAHLNAKKLLFFFFFSLTKWLSFFFLFLLISMLFLKM